LFLGLTWAGTEARPTEEKGFFWKQETRNQKPETFSELETLFIVGLTIR